ncbi:MAG: hypothetical protein IKI11_08385 [Neisseriaceae bacterium]|nr:hypothetical protein [Neisseriaceae bacterium]
MFQFNNKNTISYAIMALLCIFLVACGGSKTKKQFMEQCSMLGAKKACKCTYKKMVKKYGEEETDRLLRLQPYNTTPKDENKIMKVVAECL